MKMKDLKKKISRLEKRLRQGSQKLAELKRSLEAAEAVKALKAVRKSFARAAAARIAEAKKPAAQESEADTGRGSKAVMKIRLLVLLCISLCFSGKQPAIGQTER